MIHHITRATRHLLFWTLLALAISLTALRLALSSIEGYKTLLATEISAKVGLPVKIGRLSAKMRGFNPELLLKDIAFADATDQPVIQLQEIRLGINVLALLATRDWLPSTWVTLVGCKLSVIRKVDGSFAIVGLKASEGEPLWLLQGRKYELLHSEITWLDDKHHARPLALKPVDMAIFNDGERHRINVLMPLPDVLGKSLRVIMDLNGNFFQPASVDGNIFIVGEQLNLAQWLAGYLPDPIKVESGTGSLQAWLKLAGSQAVSIRGEAALLGFKAHRKELGALPFNSLQTRFQWARQAQWQRLDFFDLQWADDAQKTKPPLITPKINLSIGVEQSTAGVWQKLALAVDQLDLQAAAGMMVFFDGLPASYRQWLAQAQALGHLQNTRVFADLDSQHFAVNAGFSGLGMSTQQDLPGFTALTGQISGTEQQGWIDLSAEKSLLSVPNFFTQPLPVERFKGRVQWRQNLGHWMLSGTNIVFDLPGFSSESQFALSLPKTAAPPFMNWVMDFASDDVGKLAAYLPSKAMKAADFDWFSRAFPVGRVKNGKLMYASRVDKFPNRPADGLFQVVLDVEQLQLNYAPGWPLVTDVIGKARIDNKVLTCAVTSATSHNLQLGKATVINPEMGISKTLTIKGDLDGAIADVFSFLQASELKASTALFINALTPKGNTHIDADLVIPLGGVGKHKVAINAKLDGAAVNIKPLDLWINALVGNLKFTEDGMSSDRIRAKVFQQLAKIKFSHPTPNALLIDAEGLAGIEQLQQQFKIPGWQLARGELAYQLQLLLPHQDANQTASSPAKLTVQSDLQGVDLNLPGGLGKTSQQKRPLFLTFSLDDGSVLPITVNYDQHLKAAVKLAMPEQILQSGHIVIGKGDAVQPSAAGLWLDINQAQLQVSDWLNSVQTGVAGNGASLTNGNDLQSLIRQINVHSEDLQWQGSSLGRFDMDLQPHQKHWTASVDSAFGSGIAILPYELNGNEKISLDLAELNLSALKQLKATSQPASLTPSSSQSLQSPRQMPLISIKSSKTLWQGLDLGSLTVETEHLPNGMAFKQIDLMGLRLQLSLTGTWKLDDGQPQTQLQGHLQIPKAGQLLVDLNISKDLAETVGSADFSFNWSAAPYDFAVKKLLGQLDVQLKEGRILSVEPGFGRILGILALEQWAKRLQLDFSDVFEEGLTFNNINGHFDLVRGNARTNNLQVDSIPAKINLKGETDFGKRIMDYEVDVIPKSADALPIAGTIMSKMTTLIARTLTGKNQDGFFFGSHYHVKGKWDNLVVIPQHENDGLFQKTWTGITAFPWLGETNKK